jgi:elongation factor P
MLNYNEIRERAYIVLDGEPYEVLDSSIKKKNRQKPTNQTKLRNLITGAVKQEAFHQSDTVEEADIDKKKITYQFNKFNRQTGQNEYWFIEGDDRSKRFHLDSDIIGDKINFIKEGFEVDGLTFEENIIDIKLPIKVVLEVTEAPPSIKGNTEGGADKVVTLETGLKVTAPIFIEAGEKLVINTDTGEYVERAK